MVLEYEHDDLCFIIAWKFLTKIIIYALFSPRTLGFSFERELTYCRTLVWYGFSTLNIILITLFLATEKMYTGNFSALKIECM